MFSTYLKTAKCANMQDCNKRNSIVYYCMILKIGIDIKYTQGHKIMKPDFLYQFSNLNYIAKYPNWSVAGCHGNRIKNPAPCFYVQCTHTSSN